MHWISMRKLLTLTMSLLLVLQAIPVAAQSESCEPTLATRIHNMDAEATKFWNELLSEQLVPTTSDELRAQLSALPLETAIQIRLRSGEEYSGRLKAVGDDEFTISVVQELATMQEPATMLHLLLSYDDVQSVRVLEVERPSKWWGILLLVGIFGGIVAACLAGVCVD